MLRTRLRDAEQSSSRQVGTYVWTRTNESTPSRNKVVIGLVNHGGTVTGLKVEATTDELHGQPPYNVGGPFVSAKVFHPDYAVSGYSIKGKAVTQPNSTTGAFAPGDVWTRRYEGGLQLSSGSALMSTALPREATIGSQVRDPTFARDPDGLGSLGPEGWSKLRPKVEKAGLAQAVIELREAPKMLRDTAKSALKKWNALLASPKYFKYRNQRRRLGELEDLRKAPKDLAADFLNYQFGWRPFVRDVIAVCDVVLNLEKHIENTVRRNNSWQKRHWSEDVVSASALVHSEGGLANSRISPIVGSDWWQPWTSNYNVYRENVSEVWYEGVFKFYRPEFDSGLESGYPALRKARQTLSLLGGNITPKVLFDVMPYTWLAGWFSNIGDNLQMLQDQISGSVAAKYMYVMRYTHDQYRYVASTQTWEGNYVTLEAHRRLELKARIQSAGALSFSLRDPVLTGTQLAILGSLGLTRS